MGSAIDVVGYGVQELPQRRWPVQPQLQEDRATAATRFFAQTQLVASNDRISDEFLELKSTEGGTCFGDSGGPNLVGGSNVVVG